MTRARYIRLPAVCSLVATFGTSAFALNPQPLPPGEHASYASAKFAATGRTTAVYRANGQHAPRQA